MNNTIKKVLAAFLAPIAILGLVFTMFTASAIADGTTQQANNEEQNLATQATSIVIDVLPWCGWTALQASGGLITLAPGEDEDTVYDGGAINLVAIGQQFAIKVGPVSADSVVLSGDEVFVAEEENNCSWFVDDQKNGVAVSTKLSGNSFLAVSEKNEGQDAVVDVTMNFLAIPANPLTIANTPVLGACDTGDEGFDFSGSPLVVIDSQNLSKAVVAMSANQTSTNNFCSWLSNYSISIPAGLKPMFGDSTYTFTGPTITNTMMFGLTVPAPPAP